MFIHFVYDVEYGFLQDTYKNNWDKIRVVFPALVHFQILKTQASHISTFLCILRIFLAESTASEQHFARSFWTGLSKSQQQNWHIANERTNEQRKKQRNKQRNKQTYKETNEHTNIHEFIHTCIHSYIHTYIHTFIHSYIHTYIHTLPAQHIPYQPMPCHTLSLQLYAPSSTDGSSSLRWSLRRRASQQTESLLRESEQTTKIVKVIRCSRTLCDVHFVSMGWLRKLHFSIRSSMMCSVCKVWMVD